MTLDPLRVAKDLLAAIGIVTALFTFGSFMWQVGGADWSARARWLPWLGVVYGVVIALLALYALINPDAIPGAFGLDVPGTFGLDVRILGGLVLILIPLLIISWPLSGSTFVVETVAFIGAMGTLAIAGQYYARFLQTRAAAVKLCPDCQEEVKAGALTCRYCGYRFPA
jgi:hypothetical protein